MHDVAGVNKAKACLAREWGPDRRIGHLRLSVIDRRLIALDLRDELIDRRLLSVQPLTRNRILLGEAGVARQVELRVLETRLVLRLLRDRLIERRLIRARVDFNKNIALLDHLALLEVDLDDLAIDAAAHQDGLVRLHGAKPIQIDWKISLYRLCDGDWDGGYFRQAIGLVQSRPANIVAVKVGPAKVAAEHDHGHGG